jgi:ribosomal protein S3|uniref:Small ribosomal subunit protein uS3c n=1 Tax=Tetradesmus obliquus TaxID=3088 RepID=A0A249RWR9_TETOB|nr:30S ribosomal protein S3 [Tetradesmus obliquus]
MGQKIHPLGFRVGITKKHQSVWFARFHKHQYAQSVLEDRFLRKNLLKLLPQLFQKKLNNSPNMPKISHIQIVRGLIPYEIGIQIHAQNCHMIKNTFEGLEVQPNFVHNLLKNHLILEKNSVKKTSLFKNAGENIELSLTAESTNDFDSTEKKRGGLNRKGEQSLNFKNSTKKTMKSNVEKRKKLFARFHQRFLGKFIVVKNGKKITKKFDSKKQLSFKNNLLSFFKKNLQERRTFRKNKFQTSFSKSSGFSKNQKNRETISLKQKAFLNFVDSKVSKANLSKPCTKFVNFYMSQTNLSFLNALKAEMNYWNQYFENSKTEEIQKFGSFRYLPLGSQKKWNLLRFKRFEKLPLPLLLKLFKALQQKALKKLERLRKEYLVFGKFSKTKTFSYYQRVRFLQNLKKFISLRKNQNSLNFSQSTFENSAQKTTNQKFALKVASLTEKSFQKKFSKIHEEKNTIKFIDHLQALVQQHRSKNLFLYLATISESRQNLKKIQQFTKQQSDFLFGISPKTLVGLTNEEKQEILKNKVSKTFFKISQKNASQKKNFQDIFVEQLQKQRTICEKNIQLTPKISIQFYSVKAQDFQTRASAVADSIVDDLEKRKAFRGVIKKAKEDLMRTPKVKGVKIQVSGRLNGAEIARSEWVRAGRVPLQTLRANIDYCYKTAQTIYGIIGVKVWIYKGYTKTRKPTANSPSVLLDLL